MSIEEVKKQLERISNRRIQKEFIGELVVEIWEYIEDYRYKPDNCAVEFTYDKICACLFAFLQNYLDIEKLAERDL